MKQEGQQGCAWVQHTTPDYQCVDVELKLYREVTQSGGQVGQASWPASWPVAPVRRTGFFERIISGELLRVIRLIHDHGSNEGANGCGRHPVSRRSDGLAGRRGGGCGGRRGGGSKCDHTAGRLARRVLCAALWIAPGCGPGTSIPGAIARTSAARIRLAGVHVPARFEHVHPVPERPFG